MENEVKEATIASETDSEALGIVVMSGGEGKRKQKGRGSTGHKI